MCRVLLINLFAKQQDSNKNKIFQFQISNELRQCQTHLMIQSLTPVQKVMTPVDGD